MSFFISKKAESALQKISKDEEMYEYVSTKIVFQLVFSLIILFVGLVRTSIDFTGINASFIIDCAFYVLVFGLFLIESILEIILLRKNKNKSK